MLSHSYHSLPLKEQTMTSHSKQLISILKEIQISKTLWTRGELHHHPGLEIKGIGNIAFPLLPKQAEQIIERCEPAPFGRGEETIIDQNVRKTWQLSPKYFSLQNVHWRLAIYQACNQIAQDLGLKDALIKADLYKLLVYSKGCFFTPHRDTEKVPNMMGTLVVNLPSAHKGGSIILSHNHISEEYSFADLGLYQSYYVAFYADCYHEVKPIESGFRVVLVYNLSIADRKSQPNLNLHEQTTRQLSQWLEKYKNKKQPTAYLLEHAYTESNLKLDNLKGRDFAQASLLLQLAKQKGYSVFLCLVRHHKEIYGDVHNGYHSQEFVSYGDSETTIYAHHLIDPQGNRSDFRKINLDEEKEIIAEISLTEGAGFNESISEATGNEGATKDLWYQRGAVIFWPEEQDVEVILRQERMYISRHLKNFLEHHNIEQEENNKKAYQVAKHLLETSSRYSLDVSLEQLVIINDLELIKTFLQKNTDDSAFQVSPDHIIAISRNFSWKEIEPFIEQRMPDSYNKYDKDQVFIWLEELTTKHPTEDILSFILKWTQFFLAVIKKQSSLSSKTVQALLSLLIALNQKELFTQLIECSIHFTNPSFLARRYAKIIQKLLETNNSKSGNETLSAIAKDAIKRVDTYFSVKPTKPDHWSKSERLNCECSFCQQVNTFLVNPTEQTLIISKTLQRNLHHIEAETQKVNAEIEVEIGRLKYKFIGTITKDHRHFEENLRHYHLMQEIKKLCLQHFIQS